MSGLDWKKYRKTNAKANGKAVTFRSRLPSCKVIILETNVSGYKLRLPSVFSKNIKVKKGKLILCAGGKEWESSYFEENSRIVLSGGWKHFAEENYLDVGDVCGFELVSRSYVVKLRLTIFRRSKEDPSGCHQFVPDNFQRPVNSGTSTSELGEFKPKRPHFFKIILEDSNALLENKLLIPGKFVRIYGQNMAKYVQVKDPSGREWEMEWSQFGGNTWFKDGWKEFANYYSIVFGHVLIFQYHGNSQFSVVIIDKSATEIMYPDANVGEEDIEETDEDDERDEDNETDGFFEGQKWNKAFEEAASFQSKNLFFSIIMQQSYINPLSARLRIPFEFYAYFIGKDKGDVILCTNGRKWNVEFSDGTNKRTTKKPRGKLLAFGIGWKTFVDENSINVGDVCVFELINRSIFAFQVHIYRAKEKIDQSPIRKRKHDTREKAVDKELKTREAQLKHHKSIESADRFNSKKPFFRVVMEPRFLNSPFLDIPLDFVEKHLKQEASDALLLVGKRPWPMQFFPPGRFCGGWIKFVQDNALQKTDICIFEVIDKTRMVLQVHVFGSRR